MAKRTRNFDAELRASPGDVELALVYADYLIEQGDPRGELIALQTRIDRDPSQELEAAETAYLRKHAAALLGPLGEAAVSWRRGFAFRIELATADELVEILAHRSASFLAELAIDPIAAEQAVEVLALRAIDKLATVELLLDDWLEASSVLVALAERRRPNLKKLVFGTTDVESRANDGSLYEAWDLNPLVTAPIVADFAKATPKLRALELRGLYMLAGLAHPALRELTLIGDAINGCPWQYLDGELELPKLERLAVTLIKDEYRLSPIFPLTLTPTNAPALRDLAIAGEYDHGHSATTMFEVLATSAILPQLVRLAIPDLHADDVPNLARHAPRFAHLEHFHVDTFEEDVDPDECHRLLPNLT